MNRKIHKTRIIQWRDVYTRFVDRKNAFAYERDSGKSELPSLDFRCINNDRFDSWTPVVIPFEFLQLFWLLDPPRKSLRLPSRLDLKCCLSSPPIISSSLSSCYRISSSHFISFFSSISKDIPFIIFYFTLFFPLNSRSL